MRNTVKSPFKFLDAYDHDDKHIFFGRDTETKELYSRIFETNLVVLYGASGTGKTSLINCGLSNEFESTDWMPIFIRRRDGILDSWRNEVQRLAKQTMPQDVPMVKLIHSLYLDYFKPIHLIFDQFEELFILGDRKEQVAFFEELDRLLDANLPCKVILSMREEYIAYLSDYEYIIPSLFDNRIRVEKMNSRNLKEVIVKTAQAFDIELEDEEEISEMIVERLHDKNQQIDLATLQVYLDRLYRMDIDRRGADSRKIIFDKELIEKTGNLEDVMASFLEEQIAVLEKELMEQTGKRQKDVPLDILFALVTDNGTKQAIELDEIKRQLKKAKKIDEKIIDYCIQRFKEMRILRELSE